jgi:hypothetical protein
METETTKNKHIAIPYTCQYIGSEVFLNGTFEITDALPKPLKVKQTQAQIVGAQFVWTDRNMMAVSCFLTLQGGYTAIGSYSKNDNRECHEFALQRALLEAFHKAMSVLITRYATLNEAYMSLNRQ